MPIPSHRHVWLTLALLAIVPASARSQSGVSLRDPVEAVGREDSVRQAGSSKLRALLSRIARRSADSASVAAASADSINEANAAAPREVPAPDDAPSENVMHFKSNKDSLEWVRARTVAERADGFRIVVDLFAHQLYVIEKNDTLRSAPVATALNASLSYGGRTWRFETPRGVRKVLGKERDPVWRPPDWHFAEVALEHHLTLRSIERGQVIRLRDDTRLKVVGDEVGIVPPGSREFIPLSLEDHIVFDHTLFMPPIDTRQRQVEGELGHFRLILGDGFLLHGTPYGNSIGSSVTHGCVRLADDDIEWLHTNVSVGTRVYIY